MDADVFFDDFFGTPTAGSGLTVEEAAQLAAAAELANRLPESRTAKLDLDLVHAGMLPANFAQLVIGIEGHVSTVGGGTSPAEVWDYFIAATGDAAAERIAAAAGGQGTASFPVAITVEDQTAAPVLFARVALAGSSVVRYTDQFGQAVLYAEPGDYELTVQPPFGFQPVAPIPVSVVDHQQSLTVTLQRDIAELAVPPGTCAVTLQVLDQAGLPLSGLEVSHKISDGFAVLSDQWLVNAAAPAVTSTDGTVQRVAARGQVYDFTVRVSDNNLVTIRRLVPDAEAATLSMMVEA